MSSLTITISLCILSTILVFCIGGIIVSAYNIDLLEKFHWSMVGMIAVVIGPMIGYFVANVINHQLHQRQHINHERMVLRHQINANLDTMASLTKNSSDYRKHQVIYYRQTQKLTNLNHQLSKN